MFNKNKKIIEKIVDIKNQLNKFLILLLTALFPLNQQFHLRPFPSVDGLIIDYLILKISLPEILVMLLFIFNLRQLFEIFINIFKKPLSWVFLGLVLGSILTSNYIALALYENLMLILLILLGIFFYSKKELINEEFLSFSLKFWLVFLIILGSLQFYAQSSIFNNYALTGEFPYSEDHYHVKQKNVFFEDMIPPYSIFSHSNIFGGYILFILIFLYYLKKDTIRYYILVLYGLILSGSVACLLGYLTFLIVRNLNYFYLKKSLIGLVSLSLIIYFLFSFRYEEFLSDSSIYRRLYMFDLSLEKFIDKPKLLFFGSGYYNYFFEVRKDLYNYELIRFFQPPHFLPFVVIWQYGLVFLGLIVFLIVKFSSLLTKNFWILLCIIVVIGSFDHYIITNHQFKILLLILLPYSLKIKNSI